MQMLNSTSHTVNSTEDEDTCTPKYVVINSQVRLRCIVGTHRTKRKLTCGRVSCNVCIAPFFPDGLRSAHPDLCLRVPPDHPAHVRGAQRVSVSPDAWHFNVTNYKLFKLTHSPLCLLNSRSRKKMQSVANVSFLAMFIMYLLAALFGYLTFNSESFIFCLKLSTRSKHNTRTNKNLSDLDHLNSSVRKAHLIQPVPACSRLSPRLYGNVWEHHTTYIRTFLNNLNNTRKNTLCTNRGTSTLWNNLLCCF